MKKIFTLLLVMFSCLSMSSQEVTDSLHSYYIENEHNKDKDDEVFHSSGHMPSFPGGDVALMKFIKDNMIYPPEALKNRIGVRLEKSRWYVRLIKNLTKRLFD